MTKKQFNKVFAGIIGPACRGAPYPEFNKNGINEQAFSDALRLKEFSIEPYETNGNVDRVDIDWRSQSWDKDGIPGLCEEIKRCFEDIGFHGTIKIHIYDRDGEGSSNRTIKIA